MTDDLLIREALANREAEIARLHDELSALRLGKHHAETFELQAENERLRKDVIHWREARRSCIQAGDMMKAEIERLREELAQWKRAADEGHPQPCALGPQCPYCEIERLRNPGVWPRSAIEERAELIDENTRLREELDRTRDAVDIVADKKDAEIERLRKGDLYEAGWDDCAKEKDADLAKLTSAYAELDTLRHAACDQRDAYKAENERLRQQVTQRGARMQIMREWMECCPSGPTANLWADLTYDRPEVANWFDEHGIPR